MSDVARGLKDRPKTLPCKYFYDHRGSQLFEQICELPEYYLTRTELSIMGRFANQMAARLGERCLIVELGSGSSVKTRLLLQALHDPAGYVPVDISDDHMRESAQALAADFPSIPMAPVHADFSTAFELPELPNLAGPVQRRVVYFPGSTVGNFTPGETVSLLEHIARIIGVNGGLLIGVDLKKDVTVLEAAYNDSAGVTAAFNLNLLRRVQRELGADVSLDQFDHRAYYNADKGRIEMHLVSKRSQSVRLGNTVIQFDAGETIHTENSYKYTLDEFAAIAARARMRRVEVWTDAAGLFSVQYFERG